jgi:CubicO group peptidase (beta-lactamase class C family)
MLEIDYIPNETGFNDKVSGGQWIRSDSGDHDLNKYVADSSFAVVYLYKKIFSKDPTNIYFSLSLTDGVKLYVNENLIHAQYGNNYNKEGDIILGELKSGDNSIVIKTINKDWDWKIKCEILTEKQGQLIIDQRKKIHRINEGLSIKIKPANYHEGVISKVGSFPRLVLDKPVLAEKWLGGSYSISVRWFDTDVKEVFYPRYEGRYGFYTEILGSNGTILKRGGTLFFSDNDQMIWNNRLKVSPEYFPISDISKQTWKEHHDAISFYMGHVTLESILYQENATLLLSFLHEMEKHNFRKSKKLTPLIFDGDYHAKIKQKILGKESAYLDLELPKKVSLKLDVLKDKQISYKKNNLKFINNLQKICEDWVEDDGSPFDMVLAQNGEIIFHDAFGKDEYGVFTIDTPTEIASITKLFTGILFAQFVDQNIIGIDDPVGKYLPDFPLEGPKAVTMRHCFTHTSGFDGHGKFGGVHNPWLENTLFHTIKPELVGQIYNYNGMGFDLAGKVMEIVSGKSIFRLFHEYLYEPLGMKNTYHTWDLGFSVQSTALDISILAQMILNKGIYDGKKYFSKETFEAILPKDLKQYYPNINYLNEWDRNRPIGIGTTIQEWKIKDDLTGADRYMLSKNVIGHGSATSSQFRIDLENNIIITQTRRRGKSKFDKHFRKMYQHIDSYLMRNED